MLPVDKMIPSQLLTFKTLEYFIEVSHCIMFALGSLMLHSHRQFSCCFQYKYYLTEVFSLVGASGTTTPFSHDLGISFCANESACYYDYSLEGWDSKTFRFMEALASFMVQTLTETSSTVPSPSGLKSELQSFLSRVAIKGDGHLHSFSFLTFCLSSVGIIFTSLAFSCTLKSLFLLNGD